MNNVFTHSNTALCDAAPKAKSMFLDSIGNQTDAALKMRAMVKEQLLPSVAFNDVLADDLSGFFIRQLTDIELTFYEVLYKKLTGLTLFTSSSAYSQAAENILFQVWDYRGQAKIIANYDVQDFPEADVVLAQLSVPIKGIGDSFSYTIQDLRAAAMANQPLDQMKTNAARRTIEQKINQLIWFGDVDTGLVGMLSDPDVPYTTVPADGTHGATQWLTKTGQQIYRDMCYIVRQPFITSGGLFSADHLVLPPAQFELVKNTPFAENFMGTSVLTYFKQNNPDVEVSTSMELTGASSITPTNDVMIAFEKNPLYQTVALPIPFEMLPPQLMGMKYRVNCHARTAAAIIRQPIAMFIQEGI